MKVFYSLLIGLSLFSVWSPLRAGDPEGRIRKTIRLESRPELNGVTLVFQSDQAGVYHHFILEKCVDGKTYSEVARAESGKEQEQITFRDFPFERNSLQRVQYRIRAVDEVGWFDFTNVVQVDRKMDLASKQVSEPESQY
jgi:hypothetical protein